MMKFYIYLQFFSIIFVLKIIGRSKIIKKTMGLFFKKTRFKNKLFFDRLKHLINFRDTPKKSITSNLYLGLD